MNYPDSAPQPNVRLHRKATVLKMIDLDSAHGQLSRPGLTQRALGNDDCTKGQRPPPLSLASNIACAERRARSMGRSFDDFAQVSLFRFMVIGNAEARSSRTGWDLMQRNPSNSMH